MSVEAHLEHQAPAPDEDRRRRLWIAGRRALAGLLLLIAGSVRPVAQQDCSDVPVIAGRRGWSLRVVYYDMQFSGNTALPRGTVEAINKAFAEATVALGQGGLQFRAAVTDAQKQDARNAGIIINNGALDRTKGEAARAAVGFLPDGDVSYTVSATITYDFGNRNVYDPRAGDLQRLQNYIYKVTLHEIGHTMGLDDHPLSKRFEHCQNQTPGRTVVNDACDKHDASNRMPQTFTPCDKSRITHGPPGQSCCLESGMPSGGGGSGGSGPIGGGPESCRAFLPDVEDCTAICNGNMSYYTGDTCGNYWGDWCLYLYADSFPQGDLVCEVTTRVRMTASLDLEAVHDIQSAVSLRTAGGFFISADGGGWSSVGASGTSVGSHESLTLVDLNGAPLLDGDPVAFRTAAGSYLQAVNGGGGTVTALGGQPLSWETFTLVSLTTPGQVVGMGDSIALRSSSGYYVVAEGAGGGEVNANRGAIGSWETFTLLDGTGSGGPPPGGGGSGPTTLFPGEALEPGEGLFSSNGQFELKYQGDGNLVLYHGSVAVWASNTAGTSAGIAVMQQDGNFVVYDAGGTPWWHTGTWGNDGAHVKVQDDGNIVVYSTSGVPLWSRF